MEKNKLKIPKHIGIILDGNRRWAKERNLSTLEGHKRGYDLVKTMPEWFFNNGVRIVSVFVFSTENWQRSQKEVNYLMKLLQNALSEDLEEFNNRNYKLLISGKINELPGNLPEICYNAIDKTAKNTAGILNICLNYGGRAEIIEALKKMIKKKVSCDQIHEGLVKKYLYAPEIPDPDIIVRTSGEQRTSGFLLWESAYSEMLFLKKYWPDFEKLDVNIILKEYSNRKRRFGAD